MLNKKYFSNLNYAQIIAGLSVFLNIALLIICRYFPSGKLQLSQGLFIASLLIAFTSAFLFGLITWNKWKTTSTKIGSFTYPNLADYEKFAIVIANLSLLSSSTFSDFLGLYMIWWIFGGRVIRFHLVGKSIYWQFLVINLLEITLIIEVIA